MEETIKIQEEFETLIEQLERLRSINDITSANAESADKVISEINTFIQSTQAYKEFVEADLKVKSEKIDELLSELGKSAQKMNSEAHKLSSSINESFNDFKTVTSDEFHTDISELRSVFQDSIDKIGNLKSELNNSLISHRALFLEAIDKSKTETLNEIRNVRHQVSNTSNSLSQSLQTLNSKILEENSMLGKAIETNKYLLISNVVLLVVLLSLILF